MPNIYHDMIQPKGAAYRTSQIHSRSHYLEPIDDTPGRLSGNSRIWGDADPDVQSRVIDILVETSKDAGLSTREIAHVLAIARVESGFNPDAAAGTTSASGVGQFVNNTGRAYGLDSTNRFDAAAQSQALVSHFLDNRALASRRGQGEAYIYKYHHDGPVHEYGGLGLSTRKVMPLLDDYTRFVEQTFGLEHAGTASTRSGVASFRGAHEASGRSGPLREGQRGAGVADLQTALADLGYDDARGASLQADGVFGPRTAEAVRAFQTARGLQVDGIVGPNTRDALERAQQLDEVAHTGERVTASPIDHLLAAARGGDKAVLQDALTAFAATRFGQAFEAAQTSHAQQPERTAQIDPQSHCGPER